MDLQAITAIGPEQLRELLPGFLAGFIDDPEASARNRARISAALEGWSHDQLRAVLDALAGLGAERRVYHASAGLRTLSRAWARDVVLDARVTGAEHLAGAVQSGPAMVICNHLSYFDSSAIDAMLAWSGAPDLADRLVSAAGPKVYADLFRRVAASCINTLPVPQSTSFSHTASLSARELASQALESVHAAGSAMDAGQVLLIFPEGSRTRSGRLESFLPAVRRYLTATEGIRVVPAAVAGTDDIMPVGTTRLTPSAASLTFGAPRLVDSTRAAREILGWAHGEVASMLPERYRPTTADPAGGSSTSGVQ